MLYLSLMETEESNRCDTPCKTLEAFNKSFPPHWSTPIQAYHNSVSPATSFVNSYTSEFSLHPNMWVNQLQKYSIPLQYDTQHNNRSLASHLSDGAALRISEREKIIFNEKEIDSRALCDGNLQPGSIIPRKSRESGNGSSVPERATDRPACVPSASDEGHGIDDTNNNEILIKKQRCDAMLANGDAAEKEATDTENCNTVHVSRIYASEDIAVNSAELNANLGNNVAEAKPRLSKLTRRHLVDILNRGENQLRSLAPLSYAYWTSILTIEEEEIRRERKRQLNRESARRSRIRKQQELEELQNTVDNLVRENSTLKKKLVRLSEDCMELSGSNYSIEGELIEEYGSEIIAHLLATKPARITSDERLKMVKEETDQNPSTDVTGQS